MDDVWTKVCLAFDNIQCIAKEEEGKLNAASDALQAFGSYWERIYREFWTNNVYVPLWRVEILCPLEPHSAQRSNVIQSINSSLNLLTTCVNVINDELSSGNLTTASISDAAKMMCLFNGLQVCRLFLDCAATFPVLEFASVPFDIVQMTEKICTRVFWPALSETSKLISGFVDIHIVLECLEQFIQPLTIMFARRSSQFAQTASLGIAFLIGLYGQHANFLNGLQDGKIKRKSTGRARSSSSENSTRIDLISAALLNLKIRAATSLQWAFVRGSDSERESILNDLIKHPLSKYPTYWLHSSDEDQVDGTHSAHSLSILLLQMIQSVCFDSIESKDLNAADTNSVAGIYALSPLWPTGCAGINKLFELEAPNAAFSSLNCWAEMLSEMILQRFLVPSNNKLESELSIQPSEFLCLETFINYVSTATLNPYLSVSKLVALKIGHLLRRAFQAPQLSLQLAGIKAAENWSVGILKEAPSHRASSTGIVQDHHGRPPAAGGMRYPWTISDPQSSDERLCMVCGKHYCEVAPAKGGETSLWLQCCKCGRFEHLWCYEALDVEGLDKSGNIRAIMDIWVCGECLIVPDGINCGRVLLSSFQTCWVFPRKQAEASVDERDSLLPIRRRPKIDLRVSPNWEQIFSDSDPSDIPCSIMPQVWHRMILVLNHMVPVPLISQLSRMKDTEDNEIVSASHITDCGFPYHLYAAGALLDLWAQLLQGIKQSPAMPNSLPEMNLETGGSVDPIESIKDVSEKALTADPSENLTEPQHEIRSNSNDEKARQHQTKKKGDLKGRKSGGRRKEVGPPEQKVLPLSEEVVVMVTDPAASADELETSLSVCAEELQRYTIVILWHNILSLLSNKRGPEWVSEINPRGSSSMAGPRRKLSYLGMTEGGGSPSYIGCSSRGMSAKSRYISYWKSMNLSARELGEMQTSIWKGLCQHAANPKISKSKLSVASLRAMESISRVCQPIRTHPSFLQVVINAMLSQTGPTALRVKALAMIQSLLEDNLGKFDESATISKIMDFDDWAQVLFPSVLQMAESSESPPSIRIQATRLLRTYLKIYAGINDQRKQQKILLVLLLMCAEEVGDTLRNLVLDIFVDFWLVEPLNGLKHRALAEEGSSEAEIAHESVESSAFELLIKMCAKDDNRVLPSLITTLMVAARKELAFPLVLKSENNENESDLWTSFFDVVQSYALQRNLISQDDLKSVIESLVTSLFILLLKLRDKCEDLTKEEPDAQKKSAILQVLMQTTLHTMKILTTSSGGSGFFGFVAILPNLSPFLVIEQAGSAMEIQTTVSVCDLVTAAIQCGDISERDVGLRLSAQEEISRYVVSPLTKLLRLADQPFRSVLKCLAASLTATGRMEKECSMIIWPIFCQALLGLDKFQMIFAKLQSGLKETPESVSDLFAKILGNLQILFNVSWVVATCLESFPASSILAEHSDQTIEKFNAFVAKEKGVSSKLRGAVKTDSSELTLVCYDLLCDLVNSCFVIADLTASSDRLKVEAIPHLLKCLEVFLLGNALYVRSSRLASILKQSLRSTDAPIQTAALNVILSTVKLVSQQQRRPLKGVDSTKSADDEVGVSKQRHLTATPGPKKMRDNDSINTSVSPSLHRTPSSSAARSTAVSSSTSFHFRTPRVGTNATPLSRTGQVYSVLDLSQPLAIHENSIRKILTATMPEEKTSGGVKPLPLRRETAVAGGDQSTILVSTSEECFAAEELPKEKLQGDHATFNEHIKVLATQVLYEFCIQGIVNLGVIFPVVVACKMLGGSNHLIFRLTILMKRILRNSGDPTLLWCRKASELLLHINEIFVGRFQDTNSIDKLNQVDFIRFYKPLAKDYSDFIQESKHCREQVLKALFRGMVHCVGDISRKFVEENFGDESSASVTVTKIEMEFEFQIEAFSFFLKKLLLTVTAMTTIFAALPFAYESEVATVFQLISNFALTGAEHFMPAERLAKRRSQIHQADQQLNEEMDTHTISPSPQIEVSPQIEEVRVDETSIPPEELPKVLSKGLLAVACCIIKRHLKGSYNFHGKSWSALLTMPREKRLFINVDEEHGQQLKANRTDEVVCETPPLNVSSPSGQPSPECTAGTLSLEGDTTQQQETHEILLKNPDFSCLIDLMSSSNNVINEISKLLNGDLSTELFDTEILRDDQTKKMKSRSSKLLSTPPRKRQKVSP